MTEPKKAVPPRPPARAARGPAKPVVAGRLWIALGFIAVLALIANPRFNQFIIKNVAPAEDIHSDFTTWKQGGEGDIRVTVITADSTRLACAQAQAVDGNHCAFSGDRLPWPKPPDAPADDNAPNIIQPYRTSPENALIMVAGLWAVPEVAMRLHKEPPSAIPTKRLGRFDISCHVKFIGQFPEVSVRWDVTGNWQTERNAWIAKPLSCSVINS